MEPWHHLLMAGLRAAPLAGPVSLLPAKKPSRPDTADGLDPDLMIF
ncbi:hypothetical protein [Sphaerisporangium dianthi]|uniref:Uncharacterized protein n=1 Tax=Sphaerisporangium dianthi TaxID=1436120 RepID=A0ABV9CTQ4_9ACTN